MFHKKEKKNYESQSSNPFVAMFRRKDSSKHSEADGKESEVAIADEKESEVKTAEKKNFAVGIDLGTTFSGAAVFLNDDVQLVRDQEKNVLIPSRVAFNDDQILVGQEVTYQQGTNMENTIYNVKRLMGRKLEDEKVQTDQKHFPFKLTQNRNQHIQIKVCSNKEEKSFTPEEISAFILKRLKETCEAHLQDSVVDVVIGVPAYFNNNMKSATKSAGQIAGFNVKRIINEPTAAALAYGFGRDESDSSSKTHTLLVYDLGGGKCDVSILKIRGREFQVVAISGDNHLGGEDFITMMVDHLFQEFEAQTKIQKKTNLMIHRLREICEIAMNALTTDTDAPINIDAFCTTEEESENVVDFYTSITREKFEELNAHLFNKTVELVSTCLQEAGMTTDDIDEVLLVGGPTNIPKIRQLLREKFGDDKVNASINASEVVALGTAVESAILSGIESPALRNTKLIDVTPISLGIESDFDDRMSKCVLNNSPIPFESTQIAFNLMDNQESITFAIYEGENNFAKDNVYLGQFTINGIQKGRAGTVAFTTAFHLDENGILNVTAKEDKTGKKGSITIKEDFCRLNPQQVNTLSDELHNYSAHVEEIADKPRAKTKRQLERYTHEVRHYLKLESTQRSLSHATRQTCLARNEEAQRYLSNSSGATAEEIDLYQNDLRSAVDPAINELYRNETGRNLGDYC